MKLGKLFWPLVGGAAIIFSLWILYHDLRGLSFHEFRDSLLAIPPSGWALAAVATIAAYAALAAYDHLALEHLGHRISLWFITVASFTAYALAHNIGHALASLVPVHHGRAVGIAMLATLDWCCAEDDDGCCAAAARALGSARPLPEAFARLVAEVGLDVSLDADVAPETLAAQMARPENASMRRSNRREVRDEDLLMLARWVLGGGR